MLALSLTYFHVLVYVRTDGSSGTALSSWHFNSILLANTISSKVVCICSFIDRQKK